MRMIAAGDYRLQTTYDVDVVVMTGRRGVMTGDMRDEKITVVQERGLECQRSVCV